MDILACIPELPGPAAWVAAAVVSTPQRPAELSTPSISSPEPSATADTDDAESISTAPRRGSTRQTRSSRWFSPSIIALVALAAVVWTAAWRNDRLRLEAARQQRPERLAQELPATAGAARSVTP
jgi:hypothetical protein